MVSIYLYMCMTVCTHTKTDFFSGAVLESPCLVGWFVCLVYILAPVMLHTVQTSVVYESLNVISIILEYVWNLNG